MVIENWFTTPIMYHVIEDEQLDTVQKEIENVLPIIKQMNLDNPWGDGVETSFKYNQNQFLQQYDLKTLGKIIVEMRDKFLLHYNEKDFDAYRFTDSWINISKRNSFQFEHSHNTVGSRNNNILSGVYYYQTTGDDGDIEFISPNSIQASGLTIFGEQSVRFKPKVGKLLMFPSWLRHKVQLNETDNERISISFNFGRIR